VLSSFLRQVLLGPVAGVFADRLNRKLMMIIAALLRAAGLLPLFAVRGSGQAPPTLAAPSPIPHRAFCCERTLIL